LELLCDLWFELSNEDRLGILNLLAGRAEKLTGISRELDVSTQQCNRHLTRLVEAGLVRKDAEGLFSLTPFGEVVLRLNPALEFLTGNREYFMTHTLGELPSEFVVRIGELSNSEFKPNVMEGISEIEDIIKEAEEQLWVIINKRTRSVRPLVAEAIRRGVKVSSISVRSYVTELDVKREIDEEDELTVVRAEEEGQAEVADADIFGVYMYASERAVYISFPHEDGTYDYLGFVSSDPRAVVFCRDLYNYFWKRAEVLPRSVLVQRHLEYIREHGNDPEYPR
jgi:predicted transcriptional regulator